jgi:hypothetical protein
MSDTVSQIPRGTTIRSSSWPSTGTKSGIRSIGESAYAAIAAAITLGDNGVRGSRAAIHSVITSRSRVLAHAFALSSILAMPEVILPCEPAVDASLRWSSSQIGRLRPIVNQPFTVPRDEAERLVGSRHARHTPVVATDLATEIRVDETGPICRPVGLAMMEQRKRRTAL